MGYIFWDICFYGIYIFVNYGIYFNILGRFQAIFFVNYGIYILNYGIFFCELWDKLWDIFQYFLAN